MGGTVTRFVRQYCMYPFLYWFKEGRFAPPLLPQAPPSRDAKGKKKKKKDRTVAAAAAPAPATVFLTRRWYPVGLKQQQRPVALLFVLHASSTDFEILDKSMAKLADDTRAVVMGYEYPGFGHRRSETKPSFEAILAEVRKAAYQAHAFATNDVPMILVANDMASAFAFHLLAHTPEIPFAHVFVHDAHTSWSDFYWVKRKPYLPLWLLEPNLFDSREDIEQLVRGKQHVWFSHSGTNTVMPASLVYGELVARLQECWGEDEDVAEAERHVHWELHSEWSRNTTPWRTIQAEWLVPRLQNILAALK